MPANAFVAFQFAEPHLHNAWFTQWGCLRSNKRGQALLEAFASLNIALLNEGCQNTFEKAGTGSIIDLTFASNSLTQGAKWEVRGIYTASDHLAIILLLSAPARKKRHAARVNGYKIELKFELKVNATQKCVQLMNIIKSA